MMGDNENRRRIDDIPGKRRRVVNRGGGGGVSTLYDPANWNSLVHYWPLDSNANDQVGSIDFTVEGAPNTPTGVANGAYAFDGTDDRLLNSPSSLPTSAITVSAWVSFSSFPTSEGTILALVEQGGSTFSWILTHDSADDSLNVATIAGGDAPSDINSTSSLTVNTKYHTAFTYDGSTLTLYLDGQEVASSAESGSLNSLSNPRLYAGYNASSGQYTPANYIDELMVFNSALSASEIDTLYQKGV